ncbi:hypothetical protein EV193_104345 [Herbihabitans rhizosphaerae]|uniref:Uncharacterized protein n=1 Tax=Herbihabitans rhizosphaerae TaxID=1872711 RepID=A0A4Q7KQM8_9PSEU|nr:hypothetical protein [Herbihabitans rhizosphaerae]RZS39129.1 hypothetical protein EV193_104345 [Herbihabitans rhizosphaerae]
MLTSKRYVGVRFPYKPDAGYTITANGARFFDCVFEAGFTATGNDLDMRHVEVLGGVGLSGVERARFERLLIHRSGADLFNATGDAGPCTDIEVIDTCIRGSAPRAGAHADGISLRGVTRARFVNVVSDLADWFQVAGADVKNAALFLDGDPATGGNHDVAFYGCLFNGGGYTITAGATNEDLTFVDCRVGDDWEFDTALFTGTYNVIRNDGNQMLTRPVVVPGLPAAV